MTEQNSYLASLANEYKFRDVFFDPPGIISRYSGLIHFSLFLTAVRGVEPAQVLNTINEIRDACQPEVPPKKNPAVALASFLAAGERRGLNRLILLTGPELFHFAYQIAHLTSASTSSGGRGFISIFGQQAYTLKTVKGKCLAVTLRLQNQECTKAKDFTKLRDAGVPMVEIELRHPTDFAAEIFKWEVVTALACAALGLNPFRDGHTQGSFGISPERLENIANKRLSLKPAARVTQDSLSLYADGRTRRMISNLSLRGALRPFLQLRDRNGYIAILPFFKLIPEHIDILQDWRDRIRCGLGVPVQVSSGPRYLYTLGKMYKEGPANGIFTIITAEHTFGEVHLALALSEYEALENSGKPVIRLHLAQGAEKGLKELRDIVIQTMAPITTNAG